MAVTDPQVNRFIDTDCRPISNWIRAVAPVFEAIIDRYGDDIEDRLVGSNDNDIASVRPDGSPEVTKKDLVDFMAILVALDTALQTGTRMTTLSRLSNKPIGDIRM